MGGHDELAFLTRARVDHRPQHLGDDVAGLADDDPVADQHALAFDLLLVVEGGPGDGRAGDLDRLGHRERCHAAGAPDADLDVEQLGDGFFRRVLVGDRPARRPGRAAQAALERHLVDLDDHAVDFVLGVVPMLAPVVDVLVELLGRGEDLAVRRNR